MFCRVGIHKWSRLSSVQAGAEGRLFQHRHCLHCGKAGIVWLSHVRVIT